MTANTARSERLDRRKIVAAALELLDEVGLDELSTRLLATRLGVKQPALYWHFKNKGELTAALAEAMLDGATPPPPAPGDDPAAWLADRARAFRRALLAHRDGARVHAGSRPTTAQLPALDAQVTALTTTGMSPGDALRATLAVSRYTIGWVLEEQAAQDEAEEQPVLGAFPGLAAAATVFAQRDTNGNYEHGLLALITGLLAKPRGD